METILLEIIQIVLIISGNARKHVTSLAISLIVRYWLHVCARYILLSSRFVVCFVLKYYFVLVQAIKNDYHDLNSVSFVSTKWNEERYLSTCSFYRGWRIWFRFSIVELWYIWDKSKLMRSLKTIVDSSPIEYCRCSPPVVYDTIVLKCFWVMLQMGWFSYNNHLFFGFFF